MDYTIQGIDLRIRDGKKFPGDLVVQHRVGTTWHDTRMELALFLVDFFAENERARQPYVSYWRENGDTYFITECIQAVKLGWRVVADRIRRQRRDAA